MTDYHNSGDLSYYMHIKKKKFTEVQAKFLIANIIICLDFLHNCGVIHRDVRPQNLVFDERGYLHLIDFGYARFLTKYNAADTSGTPCYMAPEVVLRQPQTFTSDFFAVGVILHEIMTGRLPYPGPDRISYKQQLLDHQALLKKVDTPEQWSLEATDFINKCISRRPESRLGLNNCIELKTHVWLKEFDFKKLAKREMKSPFLPTRNPPVPKSRTLPNPELSYLQSQF